MENDLSGCWWEEIGDELWNYVDRGDGGECKINKQNVIDDDCGKLTKIITIGFATCQLNTCRLYVDNNNFVQAFKSLSIRTWKVGEGNPPNILIPLPPTKPFLSIPNQLNALHHHRVTCHFQMRKFKTIINLS